MKKRFMALFLSLVLLFGFVPSTVHAVGEGSLFYNLAMGGVCLKLKGVAQVYCGFGTVFAEYAWSNRKKLVYALAWTGGKMAKVTTPCIVANGVRYYCL